MTEESPTQTGARHMLEEERARLQGIASASEASASTLTAGDALEWLQGRAQAARRVMKGIDRMLGDA